MAFQTHEFFSNLSKETPERAIKWESRLKKVIFVDLLIRQIGCLYCHCSSIDFWRKVTDLILEVPIEQTRPFDAGVGAFEIL